MSIETTIEEPKNTVDTNLQEIGDMAIEMTGVQEVALGLSGKEAFVCTSLVENACNAEPDASKILNRKI